MRRLRLLLATLAIWLVALLTWQTAMFLAIRVWTHVQLRGLSLERTVAGMEASSLLLTLALLAGTMWATRALARAWRRSGR